MSIFSCDGTRTHSLVQRIVRDVLRNAMALEPNEKFKLPHFSGKRLLRLTQDHGRVKIVRLSFYESFKFNGSWHQFVIKLIRKNGHKYGQAGTTRKYLRKTTRISAPAKKRKAESETQHPHDADPRHGRRNVSQSRARGLLRRPSGWFRHVKHGQA